VKATMTALGVVAFFVATYALITWVFQLVLQAVGRIFEYDPIATISFWETLLLIIFLSIIGSFFKS